jgi:hypothetical protein
MNKYILADMATERLKREIGMVAVPLPEELEVVETVLPSGSMRFESALYKTDKLKRITISKRSLGESTAGTVVMLVADDEYDFPFVLADISFELAEKVEISVGFQIRPLVNDEESTRKYITPFLKWYEAICQLPAEPVFLDIGEFLKSNPPPMKYVCKMPDDYTEEVLKFTEQFFDILLDIYRKAEPVKDAERRRKMDAFRSEYNQKILGDDYSGKMLLETFGRQKTQLFYDYLVYL